jgi:hypothetical protein
MKGCDNSQRGSIPRSNRSEPRINIVALRHPGQADGISFTPAEWRCRTVDRIDRRECLDHIIVLGEAHLRRILKSCARY